MAERKLLSRYNTEVYSDGTILQKHIQLDGTDTGINLDTTVKMISRYETNVYDNGQLEERQIPMFPETYTTNCLDLSGLNIHCVCQLLVIKQCVVSLKWYMGTMSRTPVIKKLNLVEIVRSSIKKVAYGLSIKESDVYEAVTLYMAGYEGMRVDFDLFCSSVQSFLLNYISSEYIESGDCQLKVLMKQTVSKIYQLESDSPEMKAVSAFFDEPMTKLSYHDSEISYEC